MPLLHARYKKPCVVIGAGIWTSNVYLGNPHVAQIWSFRRHLPVLLSLTWWRVLWMLHRTRPSPIYVCERHPRQLIRIRRLLMLSGISRSRYLFVTDMPTEGAEHWVDRDVRFAGRTPPALRAADYPPPQTGCVRAPQLWISDAERAERDAWIRAQGWSDRRLVLLQPGNHRSMSKRRERWKRLNADDKAWPTATWVQLLKKIHAQMPDALIVLCGAPIEAEMLQELQTATGLAEVVVAGLPLRRLFALCELGHSMISVDTGPAHAAAAVGLPLVVMYGAEAPRFWLPRSPTGSPVVGVGGPPASMRVDQIPLDDVFDAWRAVVAKLHKPMSLDTPSRESTQA